MKKILFSLLFVSIGTFALSAQAITESSPQSPAPGGDKPGTRADGGKVTVPPEKSQPVKIPKALAAPTIDGHVNEEVWKTAAVFKDFYQTGPGYNTAPSRPTEVYMAYDAHNLYVAFKCWDEKDKIRATTANRDSVFGEDNVRIYLDTYNDRRRAYVLGFNPYGIQQDGIFTEGQGGDFSVDIVMESKGVIEDWGWSVEVKIPFKSIRYTAGKPWGFNAARNIDRLNNELDQWMPEDRDVSGFLVKHGKITGLDEIKYERTLQIVPSVTLSETGERVPANGFADGRFVNHQIKKDIGANIKYTISPNITLDAAINPDYAEIEADAPVISANQRFPIFFQEKRPFFLEGKEIFDSPLSVFYSRNIVDPDVAVKLTGKIDKTSFGLLVASDNAPGNYSEDERTAYRECVIRQGQPNPLNQPRVCRLGEFLDKNALFGILRLKRDFGSNNNVGFFATARVFPQNRNFLGGFDGTFKFNSATVMKFQAVATHSLKNFYDPNTNRSRYRNGNGFGYFWSLAYTKETHGWYAEIFGRSKDYRADSGFTRRTNTNQAFLAYRKSTKSNPKARLIRLNFNQFARYTFDMSGRTQYALAGARVNGQMQGQMSWGFEVGDQYEKNYEEDGFGAKRDPITGLGGAFFGAPTRAAQQPYLNFNINKTFNKHFSSYGSLSNSWNAFDYDFGAGPRYPRASAAYLAWYNACGQFPTCTTRPPALDPGPGRQLDMEVGFNYKPTDPLTVSFEYTKSKLTRNDTGLDAYDTNIFSLKSTYRFTRFTFARVRVDYDTLSSRMAGQYLVGWNPNPGTAFYVGYNDVARYNGFNPYSAPSRNNFVNDFILEPGFRRSSRTFFIRASYLFQKSF